MKRVVLMIYFFIVMTLLFVGCKSGSAIENQTNKPVKSESNNTADYKVNIKEYISYNEKNKPFTVKYAQISGVGNESLESRINQTLKSSITEWINKDCEWLSKTLMNVKCKNSKYLSLCYTIEWKDDRGKDYMSTYTRIGITVDMRTGDRVLLDDLYKNTASLKEELENYNFGNEISASISSDEANRILYDASISEKQYFEEINKTYPHVYEFIRSYISTKATFYLTDEQIVITRDVNDFNDVYIDFE